MLRTRSVSKLLLVRPINGVIARCFTKQVFVRIDHQHRIYLYLASIPGAQVTSSIIGIVELVQLDALILETSFDVGQSIHDKLLFRFRIAASRIGERYLSVRWSFIAVSQRYLHRHCRYVSWFVSRIDVIVSSVF